MRFYRALFISALLGLTACANQTTPSQTSSLVQTDDTNHRNVVMRGRMVLGNQSSTFIPCGSNHQFTLQLSAEQRASLLTTNNVAYQDQYAEFIGYLAAPSLTGFNADFVARLVVKQINYVAKDAVYECSQPPHPTQALGLVPKWLVTIENHQMRFYNRNIQAPIIQFDSTSERVSYNSSLGQLILQPQRCRLQEDGPLYGWVSSTVEDKNRNRGCARVSSFDDSASWLGKYTAQSRESLTIQLTLNRNNIAQTEYQTPDGSKVRERGFWQVIDSDSIEVVMTQNQGQYLVSSRIFHLNGSRLIATEEKIGAKTYRIQDGGLRLYKEQP